MFGPLITMPWNAFCSFALARHSCISGTHLPQHCSAPKLEKISVALAAPLEQARTIWVTVSPLQLHKYIIL